jgi:hypothetical protein
VNNAERRTQNVKSKNNEETGAVKIEISTTGIELSSGENRGFNN